MTLGAKCPGRNRCLRVFVLGCFLLFTCRRRVVWVKLFLQTRSRNGVIHAFNCNIDDTVVMNEREAVINDRLFAAGILTLQREIEAA